MASMTADAWFTRREGDSLSRRVESIDRDGPRGMQLLASQQQQNANALGRLQQEVHERFAEHTRQHEQDARRRVISRRWLVVAWTGAVATGISGLSLLLAILTTVHQLRH